MVSITEQYHYNVYNEAHNTQQGEEIEYIGICEEFPSVSWIETSPQKAYQGIRDVIAGIVEDMESNGEILPKPRG